MEPVIGAACILRTKGGWLFEIQKPHKWTTPSGDAGTAGVGCIGGALEEGEDARQALQREATEEIGSEIALQAPSPGARVFVGLDHSIRKLAPDEGDPMAALYWEGTAVGKTPRDRSVLAFRAARSSSTSERRREIQDRSTSRPFSFFRAPL